MPFLKHFNLTERPFSLTPDATLYFPSEEHEEIKNPLLYALERGEGILKVVGEVGTGKTLLTRVLMDMIVDNRAVAYVINPQSDSDWIVRALCREFGVQLEAASDPFHALNLFLLKEYEKNGRSAVVVVDEAQALGPDGLEAIRRLSNLETEKKKLLQIVLFGQSELGRLLASPALRQVNQRIVFSFDLRALSERSAIHYIRYRIAHTSANVATVDTLFDDGALQEIVKASNGIPRLINIIADKSMIAAFNDDAYQVTAEHVGDALADSREIFPRQGGGWPPLAHHRTIKIAAISVLVLAVFALALSGDFGITLRAWLSSLLRALLEMLA